MDRRKIEELREQLSCATVLEAAGFALDERESSRRALKYRRGGEVVIVSHAGAGWFDPLSDRKGDLFSLICLIDGISFVGAVERAGELIGMRVQLQSVSSRRRPARLRPAAVTHRWLSRPRLETGRPARVYLEESRHLPWSILKVAIERDLVRQGAFGSAWFRHQDGNGTITGWEERGRDWRGFSTGGTKTLFRLGDRHGDRVCVTEAAIDALSLAALENLRPGTVYASTGGGWSPSTEQAIKELADNAFLVAATDADPQGEVYADRIRTIADLAGCDFMRLKPWATDWNEELKERTERGELPHGRSPRQGERFARSPSGP